MVCPIGGCICIIIEITPIVGVSTISTLELSKLEAVKTKNPIVQLTWISSCRANRRHQPQAQRVGDQLQFPQLVLPGHSPFLCSHLQERRKIRAITASAKEFEIKLVSF